MKRSHGYALVAVVAAGVGTLVLAGIFQVAADPRLITPVCGGLLFVSAFVFWELVVKPPKAREEAWANLRGLSKPRKEVRATKLAKGSAPAERGQDPGGQAPGLLSEVRQDE